MSLQGRFSVPKTVKNRGQTFFSIFRKQSLLCVNGLIGKAGLNWFDQILDVKLALKNLFTYCAQPIKR